MIGNDDEIDTNICISFMLQDNPMKISGQGVSDICHPNNYQSAEKVLRKVISNEFSKPNQTLITMITSSVMNLANPTKNARYVTNLLVLLIRSFVFNYSQ